MTAVATSRSYYLSSLAFLVLNAVLTITGYYWERAWTFREWLMLLWGLAAILAMGYYLDNALLKVGESRIPYLWVAVWPLAFPVNLLENFGMKVLISGTTVLILFILITRSYGRSPSQTVYFLWGLLAGLPVFGDVSPLIFLPVTLMMVVLIHPLNFRQLTALLLGCISCLLWAMLLKNHVVLIPTDINNVLIRWPYDSEKKLLLTLWMALWIVGTGVGNFWLIGQLQSLKVWHRRIISASWVGLAMFPWSLIWGFEIPGAVWLSFPFSVMSLVAFFNWSPYRLGIWLFLLMNAALLIINFASW
jgi:hypothetical protein